MESLRERVVRYEGAMEVVGVPNAAGDKSARTDRLHVVLPEVLRMRGRPHTLEVPLDESTVLTHAAWAAVLVEDLLAVKRLSTQQEALRRDLIADLANGLFFDAPTLLRTDGAEVLLRHVLEARTCTPYELFARAHVTLLVEEVQGGEPRHLVHLAFRSDPVKRALGRNMREGGKAAQSGIVSALRFAIGIDEAVLSDETFVALLASPRTIDVTVEDPTRLRDRNASARFYTDAYRHVSELASLAAERLRLEPDGVVDQSASESGLTQGLESTSLCSRGVGRSRRGSLPRRALLLPCSSRGGRLAPRSWPRSH